MLSISNDPPPPLFLILCKHFFHVLSMVSRKVKCFGYGYYILPPPHLNGGSSTCPKALLCKLVFGSHANSLSLSLSPLNFIFEGFLPQVAYYNHQNKRPSCFHNIKSKGGMPKLKIAIIWTPTFGWNVVRFGFDGHYKDTFLLKKWIAYSKFANHSTRQ